MSAGSAVAEEYRIVKLPNGTHSIHSLAEAETFHPVVGPTVEGEALYVRQLRLVERVEASSEEFVVWDVGLGAASNPVCLLRSIRHLKRSVRIISFDHKKEPLAFALENLRFLTYLEPYREPLETLLEQGKLKFQDGECRVAWEVHWGDFPRMVTSSQAREWPKPHAIMYDAFSPARNPAMWCLPVFRNLYGLLDQSRPCALPTYSRSTILRVTLLLAGFYVGAGHATGEKEETTVAANVFELIEEPLDERWMQRVKRSSSAEPLHEPVYQQRPLSRESWEKLVAHPQFRIRT